MVDTIEYPIRATSVSESIYSDNICRRSDRSVSAIRRRIMSGNPIVEKVSSEILKYVDGTVTQDSYIDLILEISSRALSFCLLTI